MKLEQEALQFCKMLKELYFVRRDMKAVLHYMDEMITLMGTGEQEIATTLDEVKMKLIEEITEYDGSFQIINEELHTTRLTDSLCLVYGKLTAIPKESTFADLILHISVICKKGKDGMKAIHCNFSRPDVEIEPGKYFVSNVTRENNRMLRHELEGRERQLDNLMKYIPGALHRCRRDSYFTLEEIGESFLSMFGYTRQEIQEVFHNQFIHMIIPADRKRVVAEVSSQLQKGPDIELEYRVFCKEQEPLWIMEKGRLIDNENRGQYFYGILVEIKERKKEQEELRLSTERHKMILDQTSDIFFEWDMKTDSFYVSGNWEKRFGYELGKIQFSDRIVHSQNIHPDDIQTLTDMMKCVIEGVRFSEAEIRIRNSKNKYVWCQIRTTTQFDSNKNPVKAIGVVIDISAERRERQELLDMAQRDALTGLFNKATIKNRIEQYLTCRNDKYMQAMLIIDVDNFQSINSAYGHLCGDTVLSNIADVLKMNFRSSDLLGRIGGDEFLIFLPEVVDKEAAEFKAQRILNELDRMKPSIESAAITCSIGAVLAPNEYTDFDTLYKCADQALCYQKKSGKNGITFYDSHMQMYTESEEPIESAVGSAIVSDDLNAVEEKLAQYTFRMLYQSKDIMTSINQLLEIVGRSYDVSRVYIFENHSNDKKCDNTFEWCAPGIKPEMENLQNLSYEEDLGCYLNNFREGGIFYCRDIRELNTDLYKVLETQGICSLLQCTVMDSGKFKGFVGFDECRENRYWTKQQIATLSLIANVLAVFLTKLRLEEKLHSMMKNNEKPGS